MSASPTDLLTLAAQVEEFDATACERAATVLRSYADFQEAIAFLREQKKPVAPYYFADLARRARELGWQGGERAPDGVLLADKRACVRLAELLAALATIHASGRCGSDVMTQERILDWAREIGE